MLLCSLRLFHPSATGPLPLWTRPPPNPPRCQRRFSLHCLLPPRPHSSLRRLRIRRPPRQRIAPPRTPQLERGRLRLPPQTTSPRSPPLSRRCRRRSRWQCKLLANRTDLRKNRCVNDMLLKETNSFRVPLSSLLASESGTESPRTVWPSSCSSRCASSSLDSASLVAPPSFPDLSEILELAELSGSGDASCCVFEGEEPSSSMLASRESQGPE